MPSLSLSSVLGTGSVGAVLNVLREVDVRPIAPSLEDVFVRLTRLQVEGGALAR